MTRRLTRVFLLLVTMAAVGAAAIVTITDVASLREVNVKLAENEEALRALNAERNEIQRDLQAYRHWVGTLSDMERKVKMGEITRKAQELSKGLTLLDSREVGLDRVRRKYERQKSERVDHLRGRVLALGGVIVLCAAALFWSRPRRPLDENGNYP